MAINSHLIIWFPSTGSPWLLDTTGPSVPDRAGPEQLGPDTHARLARGGNLPDRAKMPSHEPA